MNPHFATLVVGLATQADSAITGNLPAEMMAQAGGSHRQVAQMLIDTLGMLQSKTEGHLEEDERKLLTDLLTGLRFRFVQSEKKG